MTHDGFHFIFRHLTRCFFLYRRPSPVWRSSTRKINNELYSVNDKSTNGTFSNSALRSSRPCRLLRPSPRLILAVDHLAAEWDLLGRLARNDGRKRKTKCSGQVWLSLEKTSWWPTLWLAKPTSWPKNLGSRRALVQIPPSYTSPNHKRIRLASEPAILVRRTEKPNQNSGHERCLQ